MNSRRTRTPAVAAVVLASLALACVAGPWVIPHEPNAVNLSAVHQGPSVAHPFGTDDLGRDILVRVLHGGRYSLLIGLLAAGLGTGLGTLVGAVAGYTGRWVDGLLMRVTDVAFAIPTLPLVILLASYVGSDPLSMAAVIGLLSWMSTARVVRGEVLSLRESNFVLAARTLGTGPVTILLRHLIPNVWAPVTVSGTLAVGYAILMESALSFLSLGIQPPTPTWGNLLMDAQASLATAPWLTLFPGLAIVITVLAVNFIGEGFRNAADPRRRSA